MRSLLEALARAPGAVIAAVLAGVVLVAGLSGFAIAELTSGDGDGAHHGNPGARRRGPIGRRGRGAGGGGAAGRTRGTGAGARAGATRRGVPIWPEGLTAHTVVLVTTADRAAAFRVAKAAQSSGLEAGLLPSDPYDLGTGLWLVYSGRFTTTEGAQRQARDLAARYPGAYAQLIQRVQ